MADKKDLDKLTARNQALMKAVVDIEARLMTSLELLSTITSLSAVPVKKA